MAPQARSSGTLVVAVLVETCFEENVCQGPQLWETINAVADLEVNPAIGVDVVHEAVLVDEFFWDVVQFDADVLRLVQGCLKVNVFDVEGDKLGTLALKDAVDEHLDEIQGGVLGPNVARICDVMACDGDASAVGVRCFGAKSAHDFREGDALAAVRRDVIVDDDVECVGAFYSFFCGVRGVSSNLLVQVP